MKAALNGVPSLSILDGWWIEGWFEGATGWAIGNDNQIQEATVEDADSLYGKLAAITSMFYERQRTTKQSCGRPLRSMDPF